MDRAADLGTAIHTVLQYGPEEGLQKASMRVAPEHRIWTTHIPLEETVAPLSRPECREVAFVYRGLTGTVEYLGANLERDYGELGPFDVSGTADVVLRGYRTLEVWDYKTGKHVGEVNGNAQLLHLAYMAWKTMASKAERIIIGFQRIRPDRRKMKPTVVVKDSWCEVTPWELDVHESRLQNAMARAKKVQLALVRDDIPDVNPGKWCLFCPAKPGCPAFQTEE